MRRNTAFAIPSLLISLSCSVYAPAAPSDHPPEFLNDIGKTLIKLKDKHPEDKLIIRSGGFPDNTAVCSGEPEAEFAYYFLKAQGGDAEKVMSKCEDQLKCAGFLTTADILLPDTGNDMSFEDFFSPIGVNNYEYLLGEEVRTGEGWLIFMYRDVEVMVNTNEITPDNGWNFTGENVMKHNASVSIIDPEMSNTNQGIADAVMLDEPIP